MIESGKPRPDSSDVERWLAAHLNSPVDAFTPLAGGFWSAAYAYSVSGADYVLRLGHGGEGYAIDAKASDFASATLPIPEVFETGEAMGFHFALSNRLYGDFVETRDATHSETVGAAMANLLAGLRTVDGTGKPATWYNDKATDSWRDWLLAGLDDQPGHHTSGWKEKLAEDPAKLQVFEAAVARVMTLVEAVPERRDLIHGDLLHQNVLVNKACDEVTGLFSWKCSAMGDFLFDVAWCTLWGAWFPVIAGTNMFERTLRAPDLGPADLEDARERHLCYELKIAASHMGWYVWTEDHENLDRITREIEQRL